MQLQATMVALLIPGLNMPNVWHRDAVMHQIGVTTPLYFDRRSNVRQAIKNESCQSKELCIDPRLFLPWF